MNKNSRNTNHWLSTSNINTSIKNLDFFSLSFTFWMLLWDSLFLDFYILLYFLTHSNKKDVCCFLTCSCCIFTMMEDT